VVAAAAIERERGRPAAMAIEDPSHTDVRLLLAQHRVRVLGAPVEADGAIVDAIASEAALRDAGGI
jgi:DNA-binding transcriptional MocR family regulator